MGKKIIRTIAISALLLFSTFSFASTPRATLKNIQGKVEVKTAANQSWVPAKEGMVIQTMTTISTGFDSSVTLEMDDNAVFVKALTRMTLDQLLEQQGTVKTSCYLRVGAVKASVKSAEGVKQDFQVQSPYSTASVRGTVFEYDGLNLNVIEGLVALIPGRPERIIQIPTTLEDEEDTPSEDQDDSQIEGAELAADTADSSDSTDSADGAEAPSEALAEGTEGASEDGTILAGLTESPLEAGIGDPTPELLAQIADDFSNDFVGSPAIPADPTQEIFVSAGVQAQIKVQPSGSLSTSASNDEASKKKGSSVTTSDSSSNAGTPVSSPKPTATPKHGSVEITITKP